MLIIALLIAACADAAGDATTFRPWALNDSKAFVFPRVAEKSLCERPRAGPTRDACSRKAPNFLSSRR